MGTCVARADRHDSFAPAGSNERDDADDRSGSTEGRSGADRDDSLADRSGPDELAWAALPTARLHLVIGRSGVQLRSVERRQVAALARIADSRWGELKG